MSTQWRLMPSNNWFLPYILINTTSDGRLKNSGVGRVINNQRTNRPQIDRKYTAKSVLMHFINRNKFRKDQHRSNELRRTPSNENISFLKLSNKRRCRRLPCDVSVQIFDCDMREFFPATAHNYCNFGMYLESDYAPRIGSGIALRMDKHAVGSIGLDEIPKYHFCVMWRNELSNNDHRSFYGIGLRPCKDLEEFLKLFSLYSISKV